MSLRSDIKEWWALNRREIRHMVKAARSYSLRCVRIRLVRAACCECGHKPLWPDILYTMEHDPHITWKDTPTTIRGAEGWTQARFMATCNNCGAIGTATVFYVNGVQQQYISWHWERKE